MDGIDILGKQFVRPRIDHDIDALFCCLPVVVLKMFVSRGKALLKRTMYEQCNRSIGLIAHLS